MLLAERRRRRKKTREEKAQGEKPQDAKKGRKMEPGMRKGGRAQGKGDGSVCVEEHLEYLPRGAQPKLGPPAVLPPPMSVRTVGVNKTGVTKGVGRAKKTPNRYNISSSRSNAQGLYNPLGQPLPSR